MSDESKGVAAVFAFLGVLSLCIFLGILVGKHGVAQDCVDYEKTKIDGKWYECKLK